MKKKIVLFDSNVKYIGVPIALLSITKLLDTEKFDIHIITKTAYPDYQNEILKQCEGALCFGVTSITGTPIKTGLAISRLVKDRYPSLPIIWGGWQATTLPEITLENSFVDYVCRGQGERTFSEFVDILETKNLNYLDKIDGLSYKKNSVIIHNKQRTPENLNNFQDFKLSLINWNNYLEITDYGSKALRIATSYGCAYRCGFCCEPLNSKRKWKALSSERIINFLLKLRDIINFDSLVIVDNNFFTNEKRVAGFCYGLIENNFNIKFGQVNGRTNELVRYKESTWDLLRRSGLYQILIGAESANNETLKLINKDTTVEQTLLLSQICQRYGIKLVISTIIGLPTKRYFNNKNRNKAFNSELNEIKYFYKKLFRLDQHNHLLTFVYAPLPFSPMYKTAIELGFKPPANLYEWSNYELTDIHIPWVSKKNIKKINILNYMATLLGIDFKYLLDSLPLGYRLISNPIIFILKNLNKLRMKFNFYYFPIDLFFFNNALKLFRYLNRNKNIARIGG